MSAFATLLLVLMSAPAHPRLYGIPKAAVPVHYPTGTCRKVYSHYNPLYATGITHRILLAWINELRSLSALQTSDPVLPLLRACVHMSCVAMGISECHTIDPVLWAKAKEKAHRQDDLRRLISFTHG